MIKSKNKTREYYFYITADEGEPEEEPMYVTNTKLTSKNWLLIRDTIQTMINKLELNKKCQNPQSKT